jgi:hypothetical protein
MQMMAARRGLLFYTPGWTARNVPVFRIKALAAGGNRMACLYLATLSEHES